MEDRWHSVAETAEGKVLLRAPHGRNAQHGLDLLLADVLLVSIDTDQRRQHNFKQHVVVNKYDCKTQHHCHDHYVGPVVPILCTIGQYQRISQRVKLAVTQPGNVEHQRHHGQLAQPEEPFVPADAHVHVLEAETKLVAEDQEQTHKQKCNKRRKEVEGVIA